MPVGAGLYVAITEKLRQYQVDGSIHISDNDDLKLEEKDSLFPTIQEVSNKFTSNKEQHFAFNLAASHLLRTWYWQFLRPTIPDRPQPDHEPPALKMVLCGAAGTGKTQVIKALRHFVTRWGLPRAVRVLAPTGVAAVNAGGVTIDSAFGWTPMTSAEKKLSVSEDLQRRWQGAQMVIVDEMSMVSSDVLHNIDGILNIISHKGQERNIVSERRPFGNMHIIFAGDFLQLEAISSKPVFAAGAKRDRLDHLWASFSDVVMLTQSNRFANDPHFGEILDRIKLGQITM